MGAGKESECQAYKKCATNCMEGMKLENMDGGELQLAKLFLLNSLNSCVVATA